MGDIIAGVKADAAKGEAKTDVAKGEVKDVPFDKILNFRDVGKTINEFLGEKYLSLPFS
jgi:protein-tyrosine phosphatase